MANIKSAMKRAKKAKVRALRNRTIKSTVKTMIKRFEEAVQAANVEEAKIRLQKAIKTIDKAASKGILHKNNAANKKSRLTKLYNKIAG
ncbi:MAG: small subunit ribosomal protein [Clostridia bacterium]|nr:small subunit ribosomal protein [Clostridia bacterium]MDN5321748.1 small subunit ribosomal protein [Clostridia bacterium]